MKKSCLFFTAIVFGFFSVFAEASYSVSFISVPALDMYTSPDSASQVVSQTIYNTEVTVLQTKSGFAEIETPDGYTGWVDKKYLTSRSADPDAHIAKVKNLFGNVYKDPATDIHSPLYTLPFDTRLQIIDMKDERWIKIQLADGGTGWIQRGDIEIDPEHWSMQKMLDSSRIFLGLPYYWGGVSTYGFDCSGFVQMLYRQIGFNLPRDGIDQSYFPKFIDVSKTELQPGDLMYFGFDKKISHAAVYLGNNKFIGSTVFETPVVQVCDLRVQHWKDIFITGKRYDTRNLPPFSGSSEPIPEDIKAQMKQFSWHSDCPVPIEDLAYLKLTYFGFDNKPHEGTLIVNKDIADEVLAIFKKLYDIRFPIEKMKTIDEYHGNDLAAMVDNNTSAFNCRRQTDFPDLFSVHSYGHAIDINPLFNPYSFKDQISPE